MQQDKFCNIVQKYVKNFFPVYTVHMGRITGWHELFWVVSYPLSFSGIRITVGQGEMMQMGLPQGQCNGLQVEKLEDWQSHCIMFLARETLLSMCISTPRSKNKQRPTFKEAFNWELLYGRGLHGNQFSFILNLLDLLVTKTIMHCRI